MRVIAGEWRGRRLRTAPGRDTRPTTDRVREAWMSVIASEIEDARVLDLFAGSGALGIEALSRGAAHAVFVEQAPDAIRALRSNLESLGATDRAEVVRGDAVRFAGSLPLRAFDIGFADPPYRFGFAERIAERFKESPFARILCIEHAPEDRLPELPGSHTRRYGNTSLTFVHAPE